MHATCKVLCIEIWNNAIINNFPDKLAALNAKCFHLVQIIILDLSVEQKIQILVPKYFLHVGLLLLLFSLSNYNYKYVKILILNNFFFFLYLLLVKCAARELFYYTSPYSLSYPSSIYSNL